MTIPLSERHIAAAQLSSYAAGRLDAVDELFVEAHLLVCASCRALATATVARPDAGIPDAANRLNEVWNEVCGVLDEPRPGVVERLLVGVGIKEETARMIAVAPTLRIPWLAAIMSALAFALVTAGADGERGSWLFLAVAPLAPTAGVALMYGPGSDPLWDLARAAQYSLTRLTLLRVAAVLVSTIPVAVLVGLLLPGARWWVAAVWLVPALAFVAATLWAAKYAAPIIVVGSIAVAWLAVTTYASWRRVDPAVLLRPQVQLAFLVALLACSAAVWTRDGRVTITRWQR